MKRPTTKIFLDSGDPAETRRILDLIGFLDGQTTNPTLIAKNPAARERVSRGEKFSAEEVYEFYKIVVRELSGLIPEGSISIEVYADAETTPEQMLTQGKEMFSWIPNARVKFPTTAAGLAAAERAISEGMRVNMTLCFTQEQAAAVYAATRGARRGDVFVSPFVGRLDDKGINGMDLIANILRMYQTGDKHVEVLAASVRNPAHCMQALALKSDIITAPLGVLAEWAEKGMLLPDEKFSYDSSGREPIPYHAIDLARPWPDYDIRHDLTDAGIERFSADWNALVQ